MKKDWLEIIIFPLLIVGINAVLVYSYFFQSAPGWVESIEVSFITIARWWAQNFPHVFWNPYWYAGFPMRFSYVPVVPISTAVLGSLIGDFGRAYHLLAGLAYALVPVSLFFFIRYLTKNSWAAFIGSLVFSLLPSQGNMFTGVREVQRLIGGKDFSLWRMAVMIFYGEGPHTIAQVFLPLAGLFYTRALKEKKYSDALCSSVFIALVALSNPIGLWATGILLGSISLVFLIWGKSGVFVLKQGLIIAILAYLFSSFWYTPGFIKADLMVEGGGLLSGVFAYFPWGVLGALFLLGLVLALMRKFIQSSLTAVAVLWFAFTAFIVWVFYQYGIEFAPQARRYIPELDMARAALVAILVARMGQHLEKRLSKFLTLSFYLGAIILTLLSTTRVWRTSWRFTSFVNKEDSAIALEKMNHWLAEHVNPDERVFVSSNYTFWLNFVTDIWQLRGGHWQASIHPWQTHAGYQITNGEDGEASLYWLKAFAIDWLVVSKFQSPVHYADYLHPEKFKDLLSEFYLVVDPTEVVYKVPLVHGMAGPVSLSEGQRLKQPANGADKTALAAYVNWLEEDSSILSFRRLHNDRYEVKGEIGEGKGVRVAMAFDRGFRAKDDQGGRLKVSRDPLGFLIIEPSKPGPFRIILSYGPTLDFYFGWLTFLGGILGAVYLRKRY